jgi:hypothetical protein
VMTADVAKPITRAMDANSAAIAIHSCRVISVYSSRNQ